jgi:hypothetical protein
MSASVSRTRVIALAGQFVSQIIQPLQYSKLMTGLLFLSIVMAASGQNIQQI